MASDYLAPSVTETFYLALVVQPDLRHDVTEEVFT
jgi:hypothetical protein